MQVLHSYITLNIAFFFHYIQDSFPDSLEVTVTTANIASNPELLEFSYQCRYDYDVPGSVGVSGRTATRIEDSFSCIAPLRQQVPAIPTGRGVYKLFTV